MATPTSAGPNTARPTNWWSDAVRISGPTEEGLLSNPMPNRQNQKDNSCAFLYYSSKKYIFGAIILLVCASVTGCRYSDSLQADSRSLIGRYTSGSHFYRPTRPWHKNPHTPKDVRAGTGYSLQADNLPESVCSNIFCQRLFYLIHIDFIAGRYEGPVLGTITVRAGNVGLSPCTVSNGLEQV